MMGEYGGLIGGSNDFIYALKQLMTKSMDFMQTPGGWALIAVVIALYFVFNKR